MAEDQPEGVSADDEELALGEHYESALERLQSLGYPQNAVVSALRAAHNDAALAQQILESGASGIEEEEEAEDAQVEGNPLAFLLGDEAFLAVREQLKENPARVKEFLTRLEEENPVLLALIVEFPDEFQQLLSGQDDSTAGLSVTEQVVETRLDALEITEKASVDTSGKSEEGHEPQTLRSS